MNANIDSKVLFNYSPLEINNPFLGDLKGSDKETLAGSFAQAVAQSQHALRVETPSILDPKVPTMTVKAGDSLTGLVKSYLNAQGLNPNSNDLQKYVQDVAHQNGINNPNLIYPGQKLQLASLDASIKGGGSTLIPPHAQDNALVSPSEPSALLSALSPAGVSNASSLSPIALSSASVLGAKSLGLAQPSTSNPVEPGGSVAAELHPNINAPSPSSSNPGANSIRSLQAERMAMARAAMGNLMNNSIASSLTAGAGAQASLLTGADSVGDPMGGLSGMSSMVLGGKTGTTPGANALGADPFNGVSAANHIQLMTRLNGSAYPVLQKTLDRAVDKGYIPPQDKQAVSDRILQLARQFKFSPDDFAKVSLMESDGLNPKSTNNRCHGIIQFCDGPDRGAASAGFATNPKAILGKSVLEQLDMVGKYFDQTGLKNAGPTHLDDLYLTVLTPAAKTETRTDVGLNIAGPQANYLHVNRDVRAPITRDSIVQGLHQNALDKLGIDDRSIKDAMATQASAKPKAPKSDSGNLIASANAMPVNSAQAVRDANTAAMKLSLQRLQSLRINAYLNPVFSAGLNPAGSSGTGR
jgi:LysM repeat protein